MGSSKNAYPSSEQELSAESLWVALCAGYCYA